MAHPVVHFEIMGNDGKRLQDFYGKLFGWQIDANNPQQYGMVNTGGGGGINGGIGGAQGEQRVTVYVQASDLQAILDQAERMGGKTVMPITEIPGQVTLAQFADPDGNIVGLIKG